METHDIQKKQGGAPPHPKSPKVAFADAKKARDSIPTTDAELAAPIIATLVRRGWPVSKVKIRNTLGTTRTTVDAALDLLKPLDESETKAVKTDGSKAKVVKRGREVEVVKRGREMVAFPSPSPALKTMIEDIMDFARKHDDHRLKRSDFVNSRDGKVSAVSPTLYNALKICILRGDMFNAGGGVYRLTDKGKSTPSADADGRHGVDQAIRPTDTVARAAERSW